MRQENPRLIFNKKIIFIDRDGVINKDPGGWTPHSYVTKWDQFHFLPGAKEAIKRLNDKGYSIVVVSNQAGISKGFYSQGALKKINKMMLDELKDSGGKIEKTYYCIHQDSDNCDCRKPAIGLFKRARKELKSKIEGAYFIGDGKMDIEAGKKANLKTILLLSGKTNLDHVEEWTIRPDYIFKDLLEAVNFVLKPRAKSKDERK